MFSGLNREKSNLSDALMNEVHIIATHLSNDCFDVLLSPNTAKTTFFEGRCLIALPIYSKTTLHVSVQSASSLGYFTEEVSIDYNNIIHEHIRNSWNFQ